MNQNLKKKILVSPELVSSPVGIFFQELGVELDQKYVEGSEYLFAVNEACPEIGNLPRLQTKDGLDPKLQAAVRSYISETMFIIPQGKKLLQSYFGEALDFDLVDRYSKDLKNIYTVKIHEYLNIGYFIDSIVVDAYKGQFDITALRNFLHLALGFAFKKVETCEDRMPIDISYSHNGEAFAVQLSLNVEFFAGQDELKDVHQQLTALCNFFDVTYFQKKKKLTLSSLFFKDKSLKNAKSYFLTEVSRKASASEVAEIPGEIHSGLVEKETVRYEAPKAGNAQSEKLALARKFALFIKNYRKQEESPKAAPELELGDVENYLAFYPKPDAISKLDGEIKDFILKLLKDEQLFDGISDYVQKIASSNLDERVEEIQRVLGEKSLDDIEEILIVRGNVSAEDQSVTRVKGWSEPTDGKQVVSGGDGQDASDNEKWTVKRSQINEKIQDEVVRISSQGRNVVEDDIVRVVAKELNAQERDVKVVVGGIVEEAVSGELVKNQKLEDAFALKILGQQTPDQVREKLESQITRMKKVIEQMKRELIKLQSENTTRETVGSVSTTSPDAVDSLKLKAALTKTMEMLKAKEKILEKNKGDFELTLSLKDHKIENLEKKIEELKMEFARSREFANEEKLQALESENKSLMARLELANKKVNIINDNLDNRNNEALEKREREVETLKSNMQMAQSVIERFKNDKLEMETRYQIEKEHSKRLKDENQAAGAGGSLKHELATKDGQIQALNEEKKAIEEKLRAQTIELKKTEQKLKFTTSQLESSHRKKGGAVAGQKSAEAYAKQLEQANIRLNEASSDVAEKRKEILKLKQENTVMSTKIAELEKKLSNLEKKAA